MSDSVDHKVICDWYVLNWVMSAWEKNGNFQPFSLKHLFNHHPWMKMTSRKFQDPDEATASWNSIEIRKKYIEKGKKSSIALPLP